MANTLNIKGFLNTLNIKPDEFLLPLYEVVTNALQGIEDIEENSEGKIFIEINRPKQNEMKGNGFDSGYCPILGFTISDNGVGFTKKRYDSFNEAFTEINIRKGCKGVGRYTALACFGSIVILLVI